MISTLKVASISLNIVQGNRDANLETVEQIIASLPEDFDIVVLPEFFSTGFTADSDELARLGETGTGETMQRIAEMACKYNMAIAGTFVAKIAHAYYNRAFFMEPSGEENFYDKRHLFSLSPEAKAFHAGEKPMPIIRFRGWNIALMVCYDLRFPVWSRNRDNAYDVLIVPANWPDVRGYAWEHLLIARAIENQAYVVGANRSGSDNYGNYDNQTFLLDYLGKPIGENYLDGQLSAAEFSAEKIIKFRKSFPVSADADNFTLEI